MRLQAYKLRGKGLTNNDAYVLRCQVDMLRSKGLTNNEAYILRGCVTVVITMTVLLLALQ